MTADSVIDRYTSFQGIDCSQNTLKVIDHVLRIIDDPARTNPFWERFRARLIEAGNKAEARKSDELCLACSHIYYIEELFEQWGDEEGLVALQRLEVECC